MYTYSYDALGRLKGLNRTDEYGPWTVVSDVQYGAAGELLQRRYDAVVNNMRYSGILETRSYSPDRLQLTNIRAAWGSQTLLNVSYSYSNDADGGHNNGRVAQTTDALSGETVGYQYDALQRLVKAETVGPQWGLEFRYDGFGNRLEQRVTKGSAPVSLLSYDGQTNRILTAMHTYDANGNLTRTPGMQSLQYDVENRLVAATPVSGNTELYQYGPDGKRVWRRYEGFHFYGIDGQELGVYGVTFRSDCTGELRMYVTQSARYEYFGGRRLEMEDRVGSTERF
jgi:YD repeat-containing protein